MLAPLSGGGADGVLSQLPQPGQGFFNYVLVCSLPITQARAMINKGQVPNNQPLEFITKYSKALRYINNIIRKYYTMMRSNERLRKAEIRRVTCNALKKRL